MFEQLVYLEKKNRKKKRKRFVEEKTKMLWGIHRKSKVLYGHLKKFDDIVEPGHWICLGGISYCEATSSWIDTNSLDECISTDITFAVLPPNATLSWLFL